MAPTLHQLLKTMFEAGGSDLHITTNSPPQIRVDGKLSRLDFPDMTATDTKQIAYSVLTDAQKHRFEESLELDLSFGIKGLGSFPRERLHATWRGRRGLPDHPLRDQDFPGPGAAADPGQDQRQAARPRARHRPHWIRQDDDARGDARQDQRGKTRPHDHDRGSDRVPPPSQEVRREPARASRGHALLRERSESRAAPGSRHRAHR